MPTCRTVIILFLWQSKPWESLGPRLAPFFKDLGGCIKAHTLEPLSHHYLLQRISVAVQRGNTAAILGSLPYDSDFADPFFPA